MSTMTNRLSLIGVGHTDKFGNARNEKGEVFQAPPRLIPVENKAMFPQVDSMGQPVKGEQEFMWLGTKVFTKLYEKKWTTMIENPLYYEDVRTPEGRFLYRKHFDYSPTGERIEQIGALGGGGEIKAVLTAEQHTRAVMSDRMSKIEKMLQDALTPKEDVTALTEEEKSIWEKLKSKVGLAVMFAFLSFGLMSCGTSYATLSDGARQITTPIGKSGAYIQETLIINTAAGKWDTLNVAIIAPDTLVNGAISRVVRVVEKKTLKLQKQPQKLSRLYSK